MKRNGMRSAIFIILSPRPYLCKFIQGKKFPKTPNKNPQRDFPFGYVSTNSKNRFNVTQKQLQCNLKACQIEDCSIIINTLALCISHTLSLTAHNGVHSLEFISSDNIHKVL